MPVYQATGRRDKERCLYLAAQNIRQGLQRKPVDTRLQLFEGKLASLIVPGLAAAQQAGALLENLPRLWPEADLGERRKLLLTMLEAVYVDAVEEKVIVALKPKPAFRPLFQLAVTRAESQVELLYQEGAMDGVFNQSTGDGEAVPTNNNGLRWGVPEAIVANSNDNRCVSAGDGGVELVRLTYLEAFLTALVAA